MKISDEYTQNRFERLYNINHINNLESILQYGVLCRNLLSNYGLNPVDLSNAEVQGLRDDKSLEIDIHNYACLYFNPRNPMLFYLIKNNDIDDLCVIEVSNDVLNYDGTLISDGNYASYKTTYVESSKGARLLDYSKINAKYWNNSNEEIKKENKRLACAEVLVCQCVPASIITSIHVASENARDKIERYNAGLNVIVDREMFFLSGSEQT